MEERGYVERVPERRGWWWFDANRLDRGSGEPATGSSVLERERM